MSIEVKIEQRLKQSKSHHEANVQEFAKITAIRKGAMRGEVVEQEDIKWMVRTLIQALQFKANVLELWMDDDNETLATGYTGAKKEPQLEQEPQPDVAEAQEEITAEQVQETVEKMEEDGYVIDDVGLHKEPKPVLEGMDQIKELLN